MDDHTPSSPGVKLLVVGTLTVDDGVSMEGAEFLGLPDLFSQHYHVPLLDHASSLTFLNARNIHKYELGHFSQTFCYRNTIYGPSCHNFYGLPSNLKNCGYIWER